MLLFGTFGFRVFLTSASGLFRTLGLAHGAHLLEGLLNPPAAHRCAPEVAPAIPGPNLTPDLDPGPDPNPGLGPTEAHAGTTPVLAPAPADAVPGADLAALSTAGAGVIAAPPCRIGVDTLGTGPTQTPTLAWVFLV